MCYFPTVRGTQKGTQEMCRYYKRWEVTVVRKKRETWTYHTIWNEIRGEKKKKRAEGRQRPLWLFPMVPLMLHLKKIRRIHISHFPAVFTASHWGISTAFVNTTGRNWASDKKKFWCLQVCRSKLQYFLRCGSHRTCFMSSGSILTSS